MVTWNEAKDWFADHSEQVTLAIGGIGVVLSLAGIRLGLPFDLAWLAIIFNGAHTFPAVKEATRAGTGACGGKGCGPRIVKLLAELKEQGRI